MEKTACPYYMYNLHIWHNFIGGVSASKTNTKSLPLNNDDLWHDRVITHYLVSLSLSVDHSCISEIHSPFHMQNNLNKKKYNIHVAGNTADSGVV